MECDHTVSELVQAGASELASGHLELKVGKCFFRPGLLKPAAVDEMSSSVTELRRRRLDEADVSVKFRVVGTLASLSASEVSMTGPGGISMIPAGPPQRVDVFDTIAAKISSMVESYKVEATKEPDRNAEIEAASSRLIKLIFDSGVEVDGDVVATATKAIFEALIRAKFNE